MTTQVIAFGFLFLLVASVIGVGWWQIYDHGSDDAEKRQAQAEAKNARKNTAPASPREAIGILRRLRARRERLRRENDGH